MRLIVLFFICLPILSFSQLTPEEEKEVLRLKDVIASDAHDTLKVQALVQWDNIIYFSDPIMDSTLLEQIVFTCEENLKKDLSLAEETYFTRELATGLNYLGTAMTGLGHYKSAIALHERAIPIYEKAGLINGLDGCTINLGNALYDDGNLKEAIIQFNKGIKYTDQSGNLQYKSNALMSLGNIYLNLEQIDKSLEYLHKAKNLVLNLESISSLGTIYLNLGNAYLTQNDLDSALYCYQTSLNYCKATNNDYTMSTTFNNLGEVHMKLNHMDSSFYYYSEGMRLREELNLQSDLIYSYSGLCSWYTKQKNSAKAVLWGEKALVLSNDFKSYVHTVPAAQSLYEAYQLAGQHEKSLNTYIILQNALDSIQSKSNQKELLNQEIKYEYEKNKMVDSLAFVKQKELDDIAIAKDKEKEAQEKYILYGTLGFALILIGLAFIAYRRKKKDNEIISAQKREAEHQKDEIKVAHKEIMDSIHYAERIQRSFLASEEMLKENLNDHFVFFQPKERVSGDFYWANKLSNDTLAMVNADSTGHGVPGAIMSILNTSIEEAVKEGLTAPQDIFNKTRQLIIERLKKDGSKEGGKDGMDASIICFDFKNNKISYCAAQNPIWIIRDGELTEIKPEKMPIGKHAHDNIPFVGGEFEIKKGDQIYTLTDGFQDQFGGPKGKKFMVKKMRAYVLSNSHLPMKEQHLQITEKFSEWKGEFEQVDDVCVIGVKV